ncbi:MAG: WhiB family transcriptional regulator [Acidimicrobiales bacterium]|nr:WhiB family transcriptional regulator [Acidimicrobiales bacterium]
MSAVTSVATTQLKGPSGDRFWSKAACRGPHHEIFFPPSISETRRSKRRREARAKEICSTCPIQPSCLATALGRNEQHGIWGGHTAKERRLLLMN